jgi:hypothetical protein
VSLVRHHDTLPGERRQPAPAPAVGRRWVEPFHLLPALVAAVVLVRTSLRPLWDVDVFWHLLIGRELLERGTVTGLGNAWVLAGDRDWTTTQWLSEVVLVAAHTAAGWSGILALRQLLVAGLLLAIAVAIVPGRPARVAAPIYTVATLPLWSVFAQERPQTISLLFVTLLGTWLSRALSGRWLPKPWLAIGVTVLWANLHGSWVLAPAVYLLVAVAWWTDQPRSPAVVRKPLLLAGVTVLAGCLPPLGPRGLVVPVLFRERATFVVEWAHADFLTGPGLALLALLGILGLAWARSSRQVPRGEVFVALALLAFAVLANRNLTPAVLLIAPLVAARGSVTWPERYEASLREARLLSRISAAIVACGLTASLIIVGVTDPLARAEALTIAKALGERQGQTRVLNSYDISGVLAYFGGTGTQLTIDGRADRYPREYTEAYHRALALQPGWEEFLEGADPDVAVLPIDYPLVGELLEHRDWQVLVRDGNYVLISEP